MRQPAHYKKQSIAPVRGGSGFGVAGASPSAEPTLLGGFEPLAQIDAVRRYRTDTAAMLCESCRMTAAEAVVLEAARKWIEAKEEMLAARCAAGRFRRNP